MGRTNENRCKENITYIHPSNPQKYAVVENSIKVGQRIDFNHISTLGNVTDIETAS
jgi:hypothetical protein